LRKPVAIRFWFGTDILRYVGRTLQRGREWVDLARTGKMRCFHRNYTCVGRAMVQYRIIDPTQQVSVNLTTQGVIAQESRDKFLVHLLAVATTKQTPLTLHVNAAHMWEMLESAYKAMDGAARLDLLTCERRLPAESWTVTWASRGTGDEEGMSVIAHFLMLYSCPTAFSACRSLGVVPLYVCVV
jgi:hypothetical protein